MKVPPDEQDRASARVGLTVTTKADKPECENTNCDVGGDTPKYEIEDDVVPPRVPIHHGTYDAIFIYM